jgi:hypothetical protein
VFNALSSLSAETVPPADRPLVPTVEDVQAQMASRRAKTDESEGVFDADSPTDAGFRPAGAEELGSSRGESCSDIDRETLYLSIVTSDSTVVYYKLSKGIKKPADIPDE